MPTTPFRNRQQSIPSEDGDAEMVSAEGLDLDCYPYTFSPLLLFAQDHYFDPGYSNYNSVAQFFASSLEETGVNMLENVLYDRKNMLYEELLEHVTSKRMLVTCCIDAHFTAFQVVGNSALVFYDPLNGWLKYVSSADGYKKFVLFLLLKCSYGDSQHIQENKNYYTGQDSNPTRRMIWDLWRNINKLSLDMLNGVRSKPISLNLGRYLLINDPRDPRRMSTQLTSNTCYFQVFLFGVLCKVGLPVLADDETALDVPKDDALQAASVCLAKQLLEFFVHEPSSVLRPLTNSNVVLDFMRHTEAPYYATIVRFLGHLQLPVPDYTRQYALLRDYYHSTRRLHSYERFALSSEMGSTPNSKSLQPVTDTDDSVFKLGQTNYYKYRAATLGFGFNTGITQSLNAFCEFNSLRKNQLLAFYAELKPILASAGGRRHTTTKYRDYYFMAQYEVGQPELVDLHHYTYEIDMCAIDPKKLAASDRALVERVRACNKLLGAHIYFSTQRTSDYDKFMSQSQFEGSKRHYELFLSTFMSCEFFREYCALGFSQINLREKDINSLTRTAFYGAEMMQRQAWRMEHEFEKECINQMARSTLREHLSSFGGDQDLEQGYAVAIKIGHGYTYTKYNTLMHFLNVAEAYWRNPDLNSIQLFGKDIRALLAIACQKVFFDEGHSFYHYGPIEVNGTGYGRQETDLQVASFSGGVSPYVTREKRSNKHTVIVTDRVYEHSHLLAILRRLFRAAAGVRLKSDDHILNLALLSLLLDFGLCDEYAHLLNLPWLQSLGQQEQGEAGEAGEACASGTSGSSLGAQGLDKRQLQIEVSNWINEFDKKNQTDSVTRLQVEELIFEASHKFIVNKNFNVRSKVAKLLGQLNADPIYHQYVLLVKLYVSLCQINKSAEVDYYKVRANNAYRILIPQNFSKATSDYLDVTTRRYTFSERGGFLMYGDLHLYDVRQPQPEIHLYKVRFDSHPATSSMVKYIEFSNVFRAAHSDSRYLIFIADNALHVEQSSSGSAVSIHINHIAVEVATVFVSDAISFIPCFKYADSDDLILFTSSNIHYLVDKAGQFNENYYGMKHELIGCIQSEQVYVDLNDEHVFKKFKLSELLTESKTVLYFPDYLLQVHSQQQLINLLDLAIYVRNLSLFVLVLFYLRRSSIALEFIEKEEKVTKISGPWKAAIQYVLTRANGNAKANPHYDHIFEGQFFDLNQHEALPLADFIDVLCSNFTRYQRQVDGAYQIVPTEKQKAFLRRIITAEECFHFSEVGSGKTKVVLPLLAQTFLSNNAEAHRAFARGGESKNVMIVLVPEHLVHDARTQVFRYCLNLNFAEEYRIHDDIFALLHDDVQLRSNTVTPHKRNFSSSLGFGGYGSGGGGGGGSGRPQMKQIFITSFNQFKKALTYDKIGNKVRPHRERILIVADEVDDFLDRDKLVFNICSNKGNAFNKQTLESYFEVSRSVYRREAACPPSVVAGTTNSTYWEQLHEKFGAIHLEIQEKSRSINKSFGIFNEQTLRHCATNIAQDIEGYKSLIARPYESVNRAMPGSYYSDVERTIYLTYYILMEDLAKYDDLFQQERKFISYEYWATHVRHIDYDDLVYGNATLPGLVAKHGEIKDGLTRFLYEIILRRMEIRDKSRSVNSIDVVFNFDCIGFTGTPFIDNYPTFAYIRDGREDSIPDLIDRSFYAYASETLSEAQFDERFRTFQGANSSVLLEYVPSAFMQDPHAEELSILSRVLAQAAPPRAGGAPPIPAGSGKAAAAALANGGSRRPSAEDGTKRPGTPLLEEGLARLATTGQGGGGATNGDAATNGSDAMDVSNGVVVGEGQQPEGFNVLVDLCGIFKKASIYEVRDVVRAHFGADHFHYVYHIDQTDGGDRVLDMHSDNDVHFDETFYASLVADHGAALREKVFFFVDNRNVIGKDVPFQLVYQKRFGQPLFFRSAVLAHDVDDFSKIWQAMGRSRTMNGTRFTIFTSQIASSADGVGGSGTGFADIKAHPLTRKLYVRNCDSKVAGNLSSAYQTLISLFNLSQDRFYHMDEIVNVFIEKMEMTITAKVKRHAQHLAEDVLGAAVPCGILTHILGDKFKKSSRPAIASSLPLTTELVEQLLGCIVEQKFEQRVSTGDVFDELLAFLSGEQEGSMEISYTKQQQKQKQKQHSKDQDADTMEVFDKRHQLVLQAETSDYFRYTRQPSVDVPRCALNLPVAAPILHVTYELNGRRQSIRVYPTVQFLYSHYIMPEYISSKVKELLQAYQSVPDHKVLPVDASPEGFCNRFLKTIDADCVVDAAVSQNFASSGNGSNGYGPAQLGIEVHSSHVRQNPQYTLAALRQGAYLIGVKDQFNVHDLDTNPMREHIHYVADECGFILYDKSSGGGETPRGARSVDAFGPYFIEQYILMEVLSKQEVAQNVLEYYTQSKARLQSGVSNYSEAQGKGFICWRFIQEFRQPTA